MYHDLASTLVFFTYFCNEQVQLNKMILGLHQYKFYKHLFSSNNN